MWEAVLFGVLATSSLVVGGALGSYWEAPKRVTGVLLAFASGAMVSALAFELFPEAVELGGVGPAGGGLLAGAAVFVVVNTWLDSRVASPEEAEAAAEEGDGAETPAEDEAAAAAKGDAPDLPRELAGAALQQREKVEVAAASGVGLALLAASILDGVPENLALGVSLADEESAGGSLALLAGIFAANFPEALVGAVAMRSQGRSVRFTFGMWLATALLLIPAVVIGRVALTGADPGTLAFPLAFAGGAVLAALADTLMPEAFERGRPFNAFATCAGFFLAFVLAEGW
jgi:zinc transporter, ZIP family